MKVLWLWYLRGPVVLHCADILVKCLSHLHITYMPMHFLHRYIMESLYWNINTFSEHQSFTPKHVNIYIHNNSVTEVDYNLVVNPEISNTTSSRKV
jgi:hypothetical protein